MKRVLIISPHFPPVNAPDHQRVRMALPYLKSNGWKADIICLRPDATNAAIDRSLVKTIPDNATIYPCENPMDIYYKRAGIGSLWLRHRRSIFNKGTELLSANQYDLIFFSTTQFPFFRFGPLWKNRFSVPFVCDYQDPWVNDYYFRSGSPSPPGGWLRYYPNYLFARMSELKVLRETAGIMSVSKSYFSQMKKRYGWIPEQHLHLPFGAPMGDPDYFQKEMIPSETIDKKNIRIVYIGRGGQDLMPAIKSFLTMLEEVAQNDERNMNVDFLGTSYSKTSERPIEKLANKMKLSFTVTENPDRISYSESLSRMANSDLTLVFGSADKSYSASKLNTVLMVAKNTFLVGYDRTPLVELGRKYGLKNIFCINKDDEGDGVRTLGRILNNQTVKPTYRLFTAEKMTRKMCRFFDQTIDGTNYRTGDQ